MSNVDAHLKRFEHYTKHVTIIRPTALQTTDCTVHAQNAASIRLQKSTAGVSEYEHDIRQHSGRVKPAKLGVVHQFT